MMAAMGAMNMHSRNKMPATRAVRPVRPPASTPEADSTKVVTVEVPVRAPVMVPTASEIRACFIWGMVPFSSSILAREAVPTRVPMVSNMSMMQKVMMRVMRVNQPTWAKPAKSSLNRVVFAMSAKGGTKEAVFRLSKGLMCRKMASPAQ